MKAIELIKNYKALFSTAEAKKTNADKIKGLFKKAQFAQLNDLNLKTSSATIQFHLGYDKENLCGILVETSGNPINGQTIKATSHIVKFGELPKGYTIDRDLSTKLANETEITIEEVDRRLKKYNDNIEKAVEQALNNNTLVEFFRVAKVNFKTNNDIFLTLRDNPFDNDKDLAIEDKSSDFRFDLISVNKAYMDTVKPVPPFRPGW